MLGESHKCCFAFFPLYFRRPRVSRFRCKESFFFFLFFNLLISLYTCCIGLHLALALLVRTVFLFLTISSSFFDSSDVRFLVTLNLRDLILFLVLVFADIILMVLFSHHLQGTHFKVKP